MSEAGEGEGSHLYESVVVLDRSFVARWVGARIEEVEQVSEGAMEKIAEGETPGDKESDNLM